MININLTKNLHSSNGPMTLKVNLSVNKGDIVSIFGESGAGKTSLLRMIAGLMQPDNGFININNEIWFDKAKQIDMPVKDRQLGFVFQRENLFPNMTIEENMQFALPKGQEDKQTIEELLTMVDLTQLRHKKPYELSGGQRQRAALIRVLMKRPKILLLDEPFSSLDRNMRQKLQEELLNIHQRFAMTILFVSHDPFEVSRISDRVIVLDEGKIIEDGAPKLIFSNLLNKKS